jgi:hypothetical protein
MADPVIAKAMIAEIDAMQALTEEQRGSIEKQMTTLRDAMIEKFGRARYSPFIEDFRNQNELLAVAAMQEASVSSILQGTRQDLISHYKAKGIQIAGRRKRKSSSRSRRTKKHKTT